MQAEQWISGFVPRGAPRNDGKTGNIATQTKKDQLALALLVVRTDPILFDPGGLGAEESGTERTGSTHTSLFAMQGGGRLAEKRRYYDSC
ncbi:hypothetical protein DAA51_03145 [Bradyrhizobium sp. WBAH10]|nr:hypothetical protein [Bradyrhizobium sp. WBAH30]MDD1546781.1 hypothetical protein [Bradyrhizobium sp. WBAH41]MDD1560260.1 hypothetical protein [Bradyrhizobium sp. WBAH23]MDD1567933.1 hypothetical protein [Bradyrhizobium sp. WBAH33]MDD1593784.1 hypothetical protein [Bradyrhizobium sp. WBAH42]NRB91369.1 hypothetical protein [Bradyrhizobium sp. WBAH10]QCJ87812.1 hypothetical protein DAA57_04260 [Bradyrhizobium yuanmingense]